MDFRRLFDIFPYQLTKYAQKIALANKDQLKWKYYSTSECIEEINKVSAGLIDLGLTKGEKIGIIVDAGTPQWNFLDFGMQQLGIISVPIHATTTAKEWEYIFKDANISACFVSSQALYEKLKSISPKITSLKHIYSFEKINNVPHWDDFIKVPMAKHLAKLEGIRTAIHEDDLATIIYTSGTTGTPKGVMLSHKNIISNIKATITLVPINCDKKTLSFLPLSHIFERMVVYTYIAVGASVYYSSRVDSAAEFMKEVRPHYFASVPRLLEKIYDSILDGAEKSNRLTRAVINWSLRLGERYKGKMQLSILYFLKLKIADLLVYRKWRKALGGKVEGVVVGAAALQPKLGRLFSAAGIEIREGYGLTETSPVISFNRFEPGGVRFGTVGIPIPGVDLKIENPDEDGAGEIFVKGPSVMLGYYNKPELTAGVKDEQGWFRTGDVGRLVHKRFLQITDRKKNIFKTSTGKYIAPQQLENALSVSPFIEQIMVVGFQKPFVTALIVPSMVQLKRWCKENNVHWTAPQYMLINPKVEELMDQLIEKKNQALKKEEHIREFHLLHEEWTVESGELTPTLKTKRSFILEKYKKEIDEMYSQ